jgi:hypothetical protein
MHQRHGGRSGKSTRFDRILGCCRRKRKHAVVVLRSIVADRP